MEERTASSALPSRRPTLASLSSGSALVIVRQGVWSEMAPSKHAKSGVRSCLSEELVAIRTFSSCHLARSDAWNLHAYAFTEESDTWTCPNHRHRCDRQSDRRTDGAKATRHKHLVDSPRVNLVSEALTLPQPPSFTSSHPTSTASSSRRTLRPPCPKPLLASSPRHPSLLATLLPQERSAGGRTEERSAS